MSFIFEYLKPEDLPARPALAALMHEMRRTPYGWAKSVVDDTFIACLKMDQPPKPYNPLFDDPPDKKLGDFVLLQGGVRLPFCAIADHGWDEGGPYAYFAIATLRIPRALAAAREKTVASVTHGLMSYGLHAIGDASAVSRVNVRIGEVEVEE